MASFVPTLLQIFVELANMAPATGRRFPLGKLTGAQPASNGFSLDTQLGTDRALCVAKSMQLDDALVALVSAIAPLLFPLFS